MGGRCEVSTVGMSIKAGSDLILTLKWFSNACRSAWRRQRRSTGAAWQSLSEQEGKDCKVTRIAKSMLGLEALAGGKPLGTPGNSRSLSMTHSPLPAQGHSARDAAAVELSGVGGTHRDENSERAAHPLAQAGERAAAEGRGESLREAVRSTWRE